MRCLPVAVVSLLLHAASATAQSTEEKFQDLFIAAGYCTAFGAAIGTAVLAWTEDPTANLRFVAMGASLGFLGGSVLGSYIIFAPGIADNSTVLGPEPSLLAAHAAGHDLVLRPVFNRESHRLASIEGGMTFWRF